MISKTLWGNIIKDFQKRRYRDIVQRDLHYPLDIPLDRAVVLSGPRRSGKTYLMYMSLRQNPHNVFKTTNNPSELFLSLKFAFKPLD